MRRYDANVLSLSRAGIPSRSYSGTWSGNYVVRNCATVGWRDCYPYRLGEMNDLVLTLVESGSTVTGQLGEYDRVQVSGEVTGSGITLEGTSETRVSGGRSVRRVDTLDARIDRFGRLVGTLRFTDSYIKDAGGVLSTAYEADLWQVVSYRPAR